LDFKYRIPSWHKPYNSADNDLVLFRLPSQPFRLYTSVEIHQGLKNPSCSRLLQQRRGAATPAAALRPPRSATVAAAAAVAAAALPLCRRPPGAPSRPAPGARRACKPPPAALPGWGTAPLQQALAALDLGAAAAALQATFKLMVLCGVVAWLSHRGKLPSSTSGVLSQVNGGIRAFNAVQPLVQWRLCMPFGWQSEL
jgi:hypothetical protein